MAGLLPRPLRKLIVWLFLLAVLALAGTAGWARLKLNAILADAGPGSRAISFSLASSSGTPVKTALPFTVRASVKREDVQNWHCDGGRGLVESRHVWDPAGWTWVADPPEGLPMEEFLSLQKLALYTPGNLIDALKAANGEGKDPQKEHQAAHRREVAALSLRLAAGKDLGYRWDAGPEERSKGIAACEAWWAENKGRYTQEKLGDILGGLEKVLKGSQATGAGK